MMRTSLTTLTAFSALFQIIHLTRALTIHRVRYGYFTEARPPHVACARGWFDLHIPEEDVLYQVECYPQSSGNFASSRLDNLQLDLANLGSTPWAQAAARGVDAKVVYISQYQGDAQGIYVRPDHPQSGYKGVETPFDLKGSTVAVPFGSTMHYQILFLIELFGLEGVNVINMSPSAIQTAWRNDTTELPFIDAAGIWGSAKEFILSGKEGMQAARPLMSARVLSDWGRPTFVVIVATRTFERNHPVFLKHFVGMLSKLNDSFLDELGEVDEANSHRWEASETTPRSFISSMVDTLMKSGSIAGQPSSEEKFAQRTNLGLFVQQTAQQQVSCDYLGPRPGNCTAPSLQHIATRQTAEFLVDQKILAQLGPLDLLQDESGTCRDAASVCGGDIFDGSLLYAAIQPCDACLPVGSYANVTPPVRMELDGPDHLIAALERMDNQTGRGLFATDEIGRAPAGKSSIGNSTCLNMTVLADMVGTFGDGANGEDHKSYSDDLHCRWVVVSAACQDDWAARRSNGTCKGLVEISFDTFRVWSGDFVRIYEHPDLDSCRSGQRGVLLGQLSGVYDDGALTLPKFRGHRCISVHFDTDSNQDRVYSGRVGDGFLASYDRDAIGCSNSADCNQHRCFDSKCECGGLGWGADCSETKTCLGMNMIRFSEPNTPYTLRSSDMVDPVALRNGTILSAAPVDPAIAYPNDLDCTFMLIAQEPSTIRVSIMYDLEPTHDLIWLQTGSPETSTEPYMVLTGTHKEISKSETYYLPTDNGVASMRLMTDARGRRRGFIATVQMQNIDIKDAPCPELGSMGQNCEIPHCAFTSPLAPATTLMTPEYTVGRVLSQSKSYGRVRAMPWSSTGGCRWTLEDKTIPADTVAVRLIFNSPLDLEAHASSDTGDTLSIHSTSMQQEFFLEACTNDEACSSSWQTGKCTNSSCAVKDIIELDFEGIREELPELKMSLITDRNDGNMTYKGLDFDVLLVAECPTVEGMQHCEAYGVGTCVGEDRSFCICQGNIPCGCPCEGSPPVIDRREINVALIVGIVVPVACIIIALFFVYRHQKKKKSRALKKRINHLDAEVKKFQDSVVGMRAVIRAYMPKQSSATEDDPADRPGRIEKAIWCWEENRACMEQHNTKDIYGDIDDCWIKYGELSNMELEKCYQEGLTSCSPLPGYDVDFEQMTQLNAKTNYKRNVSRQIEVIDVQPQMEDVDLSDVLIGDGTIPDDIKDEPQMIVVGGDIIQISKTHSGGEWAFGTKLHHADDMLARSLLHMAIRGTGEESSIYTDTGWFPIQETTRVPTSEDLKALQSNVGDSDVLAPPKYWDRINNRSSAERYELGPNEPEGQKVGKAFFESLHSQNFRHPVEILGVERIQNLAMWQSYVVKRQTMCHREIQDSEVMEQSNPDRLMRNAVDRFERCWLWHSTNVESIEKILQQGFNRSFCGKNATMYGKGVYFARDAAYSAHQAYAVADSAGRRYMIACRVMVGEYCPGRLDMLTPDVRDHEKNILYDSTVGLAAGDTMDNPSIYVTYHDAQAYPEYLITFRYVNSGQDNV